MLKDFYRNNSKGSVKVSDIRFYSPEADSLWNIMNLENYLYNMDFSDNGLGGLCRLTFHNAVDFSVNGLYRGNTAVMQVILENGEVEEYRLDLRGSRTYDANQRGFSLVALECRYFTKDPKEPSAMPQVPVALLSVGKCRKIYTILDNTVVPVDADKFLNKTFTKKLASLDGAMSYAELALKTYPWSKVEVVPIDEPLFKYLVKVSKK